MKKACATLSAIALVALASSEARAQSALPSQGSFAFSAERLFGYYSYKGTASQPDTQDTQNGNQFSFLWASNRTAGDVAATNVDAVPRLGFDFFVTDGLTLGTAVGYYSAAGTYKHEQVGQPRDTGDLPDISALAFAPRAGYLFRLGSHAAVWPRIGLTYVTETEKRPGNNDSTVNLLQTDFEALLVLAPMSHFAIEIGPVLDVPASGSIDTTTNGVGQPGTDLSWLTFGITAGLATYL